MLDWPVAMQQLFRGVAYGWEKQGRNCSDPLPFPRDVAYDLDARALPGYQPRRASRTFAGAAMPAEAAAPSAPTARSADACRNAVASSRLADPRAGSYSTAAKRAACRNRY